MQGLLVAAVVLNTLILVGIIIGVLVVVKKIGKSADAAQGTLDEVRREIGPTLHALQAVLRSIEGLAAKSEKELDRVDGVLRSADRVLSGATIAEAAGKVVTGSRSTVVSILAGIKEGLRVLKSRAEDRKEDT